MVELDNILPRLTHFDLSGRIEHMQPTAQGSGASCDVFMARLTPGNVTVAVKKFRPFLTKDVRIVKKLTRELYIWSKLEHTNVLPLLGFFFEGGDFPHFVSEWMQKGTLHDYMPRLGRGMKIVDMARGIASGLSYLHEKEVVHADLKSFNILISQYGEPLLADFGLSHALAASMSKMCGTSMVFAKGTVRWMAVELLSLSSLSGSEATPDEKSDIWAFGMTLYEILQREVPYGALKNDAQVALAISKGKLPERPSREKMSTLPVVERRLWELCGKCWKKKPEMRPSMLDLLSDIAEIQEGKKRRRKRGSSSSRSTGGSSVIPTSSLGPQRLPSHRVIPDFGQRAPSPVPRPAGPVMGITGNGSKGIRIPDGVSMFCDTSE